MLDGNQNLDPTDMSVHTPKGWSSDYYKIPAGSTELMDLIEHRGMSFAVGNIFKACYRLGHKAGVDRLYDLRKIKWFVEREIARWERENTED
jgi:hypothetical protein